MTDAQRAFINMICSRAIELRKAGGCLPSVCIAQAICESAWGTSGLTKVSNNLFGIKGSYQGSFVDYPTKEWINGQYVSVTDRFRKYPSLADSISDHDTFLRTVYLPGGSKRYARVLAAADYKTATQALKDCGYATSPNYPATLNGIIEVYGLTQYDVIQSAPEQTAGNVNYKAAIIPSTGLWRRTSPSNAAGVNNLYDQLAMDQGFTCDGITADGWLHIVTGEWIEACYCTKITDGHLPTVTFGTWKCSRILKPADPNMTGADVFALENALEVRGYKCNITVNEKSTGIGSFGSGCEAAVRAFQAAHPECGTGGKPDGKAGKMTITALGGAWTGK